MWGEQNNKMQRDGNSEGWLSGMSSPLKRTTLSVEIDGFRAEPATHTHGSLWIKHSDVFEAVKQHGNIISTSFSALHHPGRVFLDRNNEIMFGKILPLLCNRLAWLISKYGGCFCTGVKQGLVMNPDFLSNCLNFPSVFLLLYQNPFRIKSLTILLFLTRLCIKIQHNYNTPK